MAVLIIKKLPINNLQNNESAKDLSLYDYLHLAKLHIKAFAHPAYRTQMLNSDDAISFVAEKLMIGTYKYSPSKNTKLGTYQILCSMWAIKTWKTLLKKAQDKHCQRLDDVMNTYCLSQYKKKEKDTSDIMDKLSVLAPKQQEYIRLHYINNINMAKIGKMYGVSRQAVSFAIQQGVQKLQKLQKLQKTI